MALMSVVMGYATSYDWGVTFIPTLALYLLIGYIMDAAGQLWRLDFRDADPNNWSAQIACCRRDAVESGQYRVGRAIEQALCVALAREGSLTVVFGTTERGTAPGDTASDMQFLQMRLSWVMESVLIFKRNAIG